LILFVFKLYSFEMSFDSAFFLQFPKDFFVTTPDVTETWPIFVRSLGLIFFIALFSLSFQLVAFGGKYGLSPLEATFSKVKRDYGHLRFVYWPSLYWIVGTSDAAIRLVPLLGALSGLFLFLFGTHQRLLLFISWISLLSVDAGPSPSVYPWDCLLLESGFLALFLEQDSKSPSPLHAFSFRLLLFRVLVGFGKLKFMGSHHWNDRLYIKNFLMTQPMITKAGWFLHNLLPDSAWVVSLAIMFFVEMIAPFGVFFTGPVRTIAGLFIIALMFGIWLTGNFGYFNLLTMVLCIPCFDQSSALTLTLSHNVGNQPVFASLFILLLLPMSILQFGMNSWINCCWPFWSGVYRLRLPAPLWITQFYSRALRVLMQFRLVQAYGVFPPFTSPAQRWAVCYEGSDDKGKTWKRYELNYYLSSTKSEPRFIAPHHPRFDHAIFYESLGTGGLLQNVYHHNPYGHHCSSTIYERLQMRLLQGGEGLNAVAGFFRFNPFPNPLSPPGHVRVLVVNFTPSSIAHWWRTGEWWIERFRDDYSPSLSLKDFAKLQDVPPAKDADVAELWPFNDSTASGPEDFFFDSVFWRQRAEKCAGSISEADYKEAWDFIKDVRAFASDAIVSISKGDADDTKKRVNRRNSASKIKNEVNLDKNMSAFEIVATLHKGKVFTNLKPTVLSGLESAQVNNSIDILSEDASNAAFVWATLPDCVANLRRKGWRGEKYARVRVTLNRMIIPLLRACERVFQRVVPTEADLKLELETSTKTLLSSGINAKDALACLTGTSYSNIESFVCGKRRDFTAPEGLPHRDSSGLPIYYFDGNDDAGVPGAMRNPLRWGGFCQRLVLCGGRDLYEAIVQDLELGFESNNNDKKDKQWSILGRRFSTAGTSDHLGKASLPVVWGCLTGHGPKANGLVSSLIKKRKIKSFEDVQWVLEPSSMSTEIGSYLFCSLEYTEFTKMARSFSRLLGQSRPPMPGSPRAEEQASFLPSCLEWVPRIVAEKRLLTIISADGETIIRPEEFVIPRWRLNEDLSDWERMKDTR
jgi:hypothetical protein